jgi:hypothetical protein
MEAVLSYMMLLGLLLPQLDIVKIAVVDLVLLLIVKKSCKLLTIAKCIEEIV